MSPCRIAYHLIIDRPIPFVCTIIVDGKSNASALERTLVAIDEWTYSTSLFSRFLSAPGVTLLPLSEARNVSL